jgi:hypothetical protein
VNVFQNNFALTSIWLSTQCRPSGAIIYTDAEIEPYFGNLAALGMCLDPVRLPQVIAWMKWYVSKLNRPDIWGLTGSIYVYSISPTGEEISTGNCDSVDSYAATFLSLAWNLWQTGDPASQAYIKSIASALDMVGGVITSPKIQQPDGLTFAKPNYQFKYLQDNCEVYHGLSDAVSLFTALGNPTQAAYFSAAAASSIKGIMTMLVAGEWSVYKGVSGVLQAPNMSTFYPDAMAQLFPVLHGVVEPTSAQAVASYAAFNKAYPTWTSLSFATADDPFPQCLLGVVAKIMGDESRLDDYIASVAVKYVPSFPWPFYDSEGGWLMQATYPTTTTDKNLELDSGWVSNASAAIGGPTPYVPPTSYGFVQPPSAVSDWIEFFIEGPAYTCAVSSITRPIPANNNGLLTMNFDLVVDANTPNLAQALEFDAVVVDANKKQYVAGLQILQDGTVQLWINGKWQNAGVNVGRFVANTVIPASISYQFVWAAETYQFLSLTVSGKAYPITMPPCAAIESDWAENTLTVQIQQDLNATGGTMREWVQNLDSAWS